MHRLLQSFLLWFLCQYSTVYSQQSGGLTGEQVHRLDSISVQDVPPAAPGIATAIIRNGEVIYQKTAGFASLQDSVRITPQTRFNIASNGKQFTALAILLLIDAKKISLTDDIRKYLPEIYPGMKQQITIQHLLTHTSGIRDVYDLWSLQGLTWWKHLFANKDALELIAKQKELNAKPGSIYRYSNTNYILLACIIERISGKSFVEFTNEMFRALNMPNTSFEDDHTNIRGPIAKAYFNFGTWTTYNWIWNVCGDGNIFSTLDDQIQWEQLLQGKKSTTIKRQLLAKSQQLTDHSPTGRYGYGLEFGSYKKLPYQFHEGATGAWKATVIRFPHKNIAMLTFTNTGKCTPDRQTRQLADVIFNLKDDQQYFLTKPAKAGALIKEEEIIGTYQTANNFTFQFEKRDSTIYLKRFGRNDVKLEREAGNIYHQAFDPDFKQEFTRNKKGDLEVTAYYTSHAPYTLTKLSSDWTNYNYLSLNGKYFNTETGVTIEIQFINDKNYYVRIGSQDSISALLLSPGKLLANNYILQFNSTASRKSEVMLSADRINNVRFIRVNDQAVQ